MARCATLRRTRACRRPLPLRKRHTPHVTSLQVRALISYLSNNVPIFKPAAMSSALLRRIVLRAILVHVTAEDVKEGKFVFVRGIQSPCACLLLHGRLQIKAGNEGFTSEVGPWTPLSLQARTVTYRDIPWHAVIYCSRCKRVP
jgi:hypothetical protein